MSWRKGIGVVVVSTVATGIALNVLKDSNHAPEPRPLAEIEKSFQQPVDLPASTPPVSDPIHETSSAEPVLDEPDDEPRGMVRPLTDSMRKWATAIETGQQLTIAMDGEERSFLFRPLDVTSDGFRFSTGVDTEYSAEYRVFEGREFMGRAWSWPGIHGRGS